jgi:hypothetical protein
LVTSLFDPNVEKFFFVCPRYLLSVRSTMVQESLFRLIVEKNQKKGLLASVTSKTISESNISYPVF